MYLFLKLMKDTIAVLVQDNQLLNASFNRDSRDRQTEGEVGGRGRGGGGSLIIIKISNSVGP